MPALDAPLPACSRTGCCFGTPTAASPGWSRCWTAQTGAGSELRANAPVVAVPTATRAPGGGRQPAVSADFHAASSALVSGGLVAESSVAPPGDGDGGEFGLA